MSHLKIYVRKCRQCGNEFTVSGRAAGRKAMCSKECKEARQVQHERNYRARQREIYNPWLWENTILEWDE